MKPTRLVRLNDKLFPGSFLESVTWLSNSSITLRVLVKSQSILYYTNTQKQTVGGDLSPISLCHCVCVLSGNIALA